MDTGNRMNYGYGICNNCSVEFSIDLSQRKLPHAAPCGHSVCEGCVMEEVHSQNRRQQLRCTPCNQKVVVGVDAKKEIVRTGDVASIFPPDFYTIGQLLWNQRFDRSRNKNRIPLPPRIAMVAPRDPHLYSAAICVECSKAANCFCLDCAMNLCDLCFDGIHSFRTFKNHTKTDSKTNSESWTLKKCDVHRGNELHFFCNNCSRYVCNDCISSLNQSCKNHDFISVAVKTQNHREELKAYTIKLCDVHRTLSQTRRDLEKIIGSTQDSSNIDNISNICNIRSNFGRARSLLQLKEKELLKYLWEVNNTVSMKLLKELDTLIHNESKVKSLLIALKMFLSDESKIRVNVMQLSLMVQNTIDTPCHINEEIKNLIPKVVINEDIMNNITNICTIETIGFEKLNIQPMTSLHSLSGTSSQLMLIEDESEIIDLIDDDDDNPDVMNNIFSNIKEGSTLKACLTHINNPYDIYIQRWETISLVNEMTQYFKESNAQACPVSEIKLNKVYITYDEKEKQWYRVLTLENFKMADDDGKKQWYFKVEYLDYGHSSTVSASSIASPDKYADVKKTVIRCLIACRPINFKWTTDDKSLMERMLNKSQNCLVKVYKVMESSLEVDIYPEPVSKSDVSVSIVEVFVFLGKATSYVRNDPNKNIALVKDWQYKPVMPVDDLKTDDEVVMTRIVNSNSFYVRKNALRDTYNMIESKLNEIYNIKNEVDNMNYYPMKNMCVAVYNEKLNWCRGRIRFVNSRRDIQVFFVDFGYIENVPWNQLRRLEEFFYDYHVMAFKCALGGIPEVIHRRKSKAVKVLEDCMESSNPLTVKVMSVNVGVYDIDLIVTANGTSSSVNEIYIKHGLVISLGNNKITYNSPRDNGDNCQMPNKKHKFGKENVNATLKKKPPVDSEERKETSDGKMYVKILSADNPSNVYVSLLSQSAELKSLTDKMAALYSSNESGPHEFQPGDRCAAYLSDQKCWCRGTIKEINDATKVFRVYFGDIAITADVSDVRLLEPEFSNLPEAAVRCYLHGISPAMGKNWPNVTNEYLQEVISGCEEFHITRVSQANEEGQAIILHAHCVEYGGALDPTVYMWKVVNELIVEKGLAIRDETAINVAADVPPEEDMITIDVADGDEEEEAMISIDIADEDEAEEETVMDQEDYVDIDISKAEAMDIGEPEFIPVAEDSSPPLLKSPPVVIPKVITKWLPAALPSKRNFDGVATYIDDDFGIYVHVPKYNTELNRINNFLAKYENSEAGDEDMFWYEGQPCVAEWSHDSKYYRGVVLKDLGDGEFTVMFVDYGNRAKCHISKMRKCVDFDDVPVQCYKFKVPGIKPNTGDGWCPKVLDYVHSKIVEKAASITLLGIGEDDTIYVMLKVEDSLDLVDLLLRKKLACTVDFPKIRQIS